MWPRAESGRKVAYLTIATFVLLAAVLTMLATGVSQHGSKVSQGGDPTRETPR